MGTDQEPRAELFVKTMTARRAPKPVRHQITSLMAEAAKKAGILEPDLIENWADIVGDELAEACRPVKILRDRRAETLIVSVPNGGAAMKVQYAQSQILARANSWTKRRRLTKLLIEQSGAAPKRRWRSSNVPSKNEAPKVADALPPAQSVEEALKRLKRALSDQ